MTQEHLIPQDISKRPDFKEITSKGGKVRSEAKKRAQQIASVKRIKDPVKREAKIRELLTNREELGKHILSIFEDVMDDPEISSRLKKDVGEAQIKFLQAYYGTIAKNLNINLDFNEYLNQREENWKKQYLETWNKRIKKSGDVSTSQKSSSE